VIQEYNGNLTTYYSKAKQILKIEPKNGSTFYYHDDSKQIWREMREMERGENRK
jgi:hypothetical protein